MHNELIVLTPKSEAIHVIFGKRYKDSNYRMETYTRRRNCFQPRACKPETRMGVYKGVIQPAEGTVVIDKAPLAH